MSLAASEWLTSEFEARFGAESSSGGAVFVAAPGRTEIAGNHTDHEGGHVIAASIDRYITGVARANASSVIRFVSRGYDAVEIDLAAADAYSVYEDELGSTKALIRGMAALIAREGYEPCGFDAVCESNVLGGSGLSSSAAFELEVAQMMNALWADGALDSTRLAVLAQEDENRFFGKPCGLMDQAAVALGGIQHMSFETPGELAADAIPFDFADAGYALCIVGVGADHSALIGDYAAVPAAMQAIAAELGCECLGQTSEDALLVAIPTLREKLGDRAVLRALHYFREDRLVEERAAALREDDIDTFLELTRLSGASSAMYLQNVSCGVEEQPAMLAIALAEEVLAGEGAVRIHGGGFGGTIQAFVPSARTHEFAQVMDAVFGEGACGVYGIDHEGARFAWL